MNRNRIMIVIRNAALLTGCYFLLLTGVAALLIKGVIGEGRALIACRLASAAIAVFYVLLTGTKKTPGPEKWTSLAGFGLAVPVLGYLGGDFFAAKNFAGFLLSVITGAGAGAIFGKKKHKKRRKRKRSGEHNEAIRKK